MWIFGIITKKEFTEYKKEGYDIKVYDEHSFNKFLEPKQNFKESKTDKSKVLAGIWLDDDIKSHLIIG